MTTARIASVLTILAILVCLAVMGIPWGSSLPLANFSGQLTYATCEGGLDFSGSFTLYGLKERPRQIKLWMIWGDEEYEMEVDRKTASFMGNITSELCFPPAMEARLEVDGEVVAQGIIELPSKNPPCVHILRFSSTS